MTQEQHHESRESRSSSPAVHANADSEQVAGADAVSPELGAGDEARALRRRRRRWIAAGAVTALAASGLVIAGATVPVNRVIEGPGPTWNVLTGPSQEDPARDIITVSGAQTYPAGGALRMTTVSVSGCPGHPVTLFDVIGAHLSRDKAVLDREAVCPSSLSEEDVEKSNQAQMASSQDTAIVAALMETGLASRMILTIEGVAPPQGEIGVSKGDVLVSITPEGRETTQVTTYAALRELLTSVPQGTKVDLGIERNGRPMTVQLTTVAPADADSDGKPDSEGSLLGLYLSARADSDIQASFGLSDVGGPSAGTMFALGIIDELTPGDLTGGRDIAGTGTIGLDSTVGPIGGVAQKMAGAKKDGAEYFLAPASNCKDVVGHVPDGLEVYAVSTLHEAVTTTEAIAAGDTSGATTCEMVVSK